MATRRCLTPLRSDAAASRYMSARPAATIARHSRTQPHRNFATPSSNTKSPAHVPPVMISPEYALTPLSPSIGASISSLPLDKPLSSSLISSLRSALLNHNILLFNQREPLTPPQFVSFASQFGQPIEYPFVTGIPNHPEVIEVSKKATDTGSNFGGVWHSDTTYLSDPPMGTLLQALEIPPFGGGDTMFANQYAAYESLSPALKGILDGLKCIQSSAKADTTKTREDRVKDSGKGSGDLEEVHPVVRTHPETGRKALYVNVAHTTRFEGWTEEESRGLLEFLWKTQVRMEFTCRVRWRPGMIAFWDNRCTLHYPLNDYHGYARRMHRITLAGDRPR